MDTIQQARKILSNAEASLRELIMGSLKDQQYGEVAEVAGMADAVAKLLHGGSLLQPIATRAQAQRPWEGPNPESKRSAATRGAARNQDYPRFERDGDRLVKIAWSKKHREEYEHRAPREAVDAFVRHLTARVGEGEVFDVDGLLPVPDLRGGEIPAYQLYLTLAWLRNIDAVEKKGRDGYLLRDRSLGDGGLDKFWSATPARKA